MSVRSQEGIRLESTAIPLPSRLKDKKVLFVLCFFFFFPERHRESLGLRKAVLEN